MQIAPAVHFWYAYRHHEDDSRGDEGWRLCPAKRDRQPSFCVRVLLAAREAAVAPHAKGHKKAPPTANSVGTVRLRLQDTARKLTQAESFELCRQLRHIQVSP